MSVPAAFITVILLWSTTPLAIKWSADGVGFLAGVTARMLIGLVLCLLVLGLLRIPMHWREAPARRVYLITGFSIFGAMMAVYWGAQYIPSGMVAVIYGMAPILTGVLAAWLLQEQTLTPMRIGGSLLGLGGLMMIFSHGFSGGPMMLFGILMVMLSMSIHAFSAVLLKRLTMPVHPLAMTTGGLMIAVPLFVTSYLLAQPGPELLPLAQVSVRALASIVYLGVCATVVGFGLYYFLLSRVTAGSLSLVTLITPVLALYWGAIFNGESPSIDTLIGTVMIIGGLGLYQWRALSRLPQLLRRPRGQEL